MVESTEMGSHLGVSSPRDVNVSIIVIGRSRIHKVSPFVRSSVYLHAHARIL